MSLQSIGSRYVPRFRGTYINTISYEALDVVDNGMGTSYISKIPTPAGVPLTNTTYWKIYGAYSGAVIDLLNQLSEVRSNLTWFVVSPDMTQTEIQTAIAEHDNVYFPKGEYHFYQASDYTAYIDARSNMNIWIDGDLIWEPDSFDGGALISIKNVDNVRLFGAGTLTGNKYTHGNVQTEQQHCISILDSNNVNVEGLTCEKAWGDGIIVAGIEPLRGKKSTNVFINNVICDDNRRNGIGISSAVRCVVTNSKFVNSGKNIGTNPMAGIAIETDENGQSMDEILINNCVSYGNVHAAAYVSTHVDGTITFDGCNLTTTHNDYCGIGLATLDNNAAAHFIIRDCYITGKRGLGATINKFSKFDAENVVFDGITKSLLYSEGTQLTNSTLKCVVKDSNIGVALFEFFYQPRDCVTKCLFDIDMINTTLNETVNQLMFVISDNIVNIKSDYVHEILSPFDRSFGYVHQLYTDGSISAGVTLGINLENVFIGTTYTIKNTSSSGVGLYSPGCLFDSPDGVNLINTGDVAVVERVPTDGTNSQVIIHIYRA